MLITSTLFYTQFAFIQPVYASPDLYYSKPTSHSETLGNFEVGHPATDAYDKDNATYAEFNYELAGGAAGTYYFDLKDFTKAGGTISSVDFKMKYSASGNSKSGTYSIQFSIDGSSWTTLVAATTADHSVPGAGCDVWASQTCPVGSWDWTKINNIQFRVETVWARRGTGMFQLYEGWVTVTFTPPATPTVYLDPANKTDLTLTPPAEQYSLTIRPDAEGTYDEWYAWDDPYNPASADYSNWDEATPDDGDYNFIDDEVWFQSSTLTNHVSETWSIAKVKLTVRASASQTSDDFLYPMLVLGGWGYDGLVIANVSTSYTEYTSTWGVNPATQDQWTWSEIDSLEAGVWTDSNATGVWDSGLEIYVSQLYVEVFGPGIKFDVNVDYVSELWQWQFELYYNPDVINGVYADEGTGAPVGFDPDGFLASEGASVNPAPGPGWDNTLGKMWLVSAFMIGKDKNVTGGGRLATFMVEVVGKGETNLTLGDLTLLFVDTSIWPILGHGYFRNVAKADLPTASFSWSPDSPLPDPTEGYNVTFDASASTPNGGSIVEYKWYFGASFPYDIIHEVVIEAAPDDTISYNYTQRTPPGKVYNVTLTVKDSDGVVASAKDSFTVKAYDITIIATSLNWTGPGSGLPTPEITVGDSVEINVTVLNEGDYSSSLFNVSAYYQYPAGAITLIGTQTGLSLGAGLETNATITWDTSSLTVTDVFYLVWANCTAVDYEYDTGDNEGGSKTYMVRPSAVPEFPLGVAMEIGIAITIIYLWWRSKRRTKPSKTHLNSSLQALKQG